MMVMLNGKYVATALSLGFIIEALTPNKISTVSYRKTIKNLNIAKFISTIPHLYSLYMSILEDDAPKPRIGFWLRKVALGVLNDKLVGTNTCFGYALLTIPIVYAVKHFNDILDPMKLAENATELVLSTTSNEDIKDFYDALRTVNPSYTNTYVGNVPDIRSERLNGYSLLNVLLESSYLDLITYEITHKYRLTIDAYQYMDKLNEGKQVDILECVSRTQHYMISKYLDTEVVKGAGLSVALFIKSYQTIINSFRESKETQLKLRRTLDRYLRSKNINLGTIADILALATSFTLLKHSILNPLVSSNDVE